MLSQGPPHLRTQLLPDVFPTQGEIEDMLNHLSPDPIHPSLAVIDPLIPPASAFIGQHTFAQPQLYDTRGFSTYPRVIDTLLHVFSEDRPLAKQNMWALRHFLALQVYAQDFVNVPSAQSPAFEQKTLVDELEGVIVRIRQMTAYVLTSAADDGWRGTAVGAVLEDKGVSDGGALATLLVDAVNMAKQRDLSRDVRVLRIILDHILHGIGREEADRWMLLARKIDSIGEASDPKVVLRYLLQLTQLRKPRWL